MSRRSQFEESYVVAIGEVASAYALAEWNAIYAASIFFPTFVREAEYGVITASGITRKLEECASKAGLSEAELRRLIDLWKIAADGRNDVLHGKPCTSTNGEQRLSRHGKILEFHDVNLRADLLHEISALLNAFYHARVGSVAGDS